MRLHDRSQIVKHRRNREICYALAKPFLNEQIVSVSAQFSHSVTSICCVETTCTQHISRPFGRGEDVRAKDAAALADGHEERHARRALGLRAEVVNIWR